MVWYFVNFVEQFVLKMALLRGNSTALFLGAFLVVKIFLRLRLKTIFRKNATGTLGYKDVSVPRIIQQLRTWSAFSKTHVMIYYETIIFP